MIGRVISGRYVVEAVIGQGGMAIVYRAYDRIKKHTVAIKVLRKEYQSDAEFLRRFSREAEAASKVSHENIVNMIDVGQDGDLRYIVMEYIDGITLKEKIRREGRIQPDQALRMTIRILAAVDHAHRNGMVHRDIKPQNILVDKRGHVRVADFGIVRFTTAASNEASGKKSNVALGSVHYMSPEQAQGKVADEKSDLYSTAVVLYEMLTGQVPFDDPSPDVIAYMHVTQTPQSPRALQSGVSKALEEVLMRALSKDPSQRYQTASEMAHDLRKTVTHPRGGFVVYPGEQKAAERDTAKTKTAQSNAKRIRLLVIFVVVVVTASVALLGWYVHDIRSHSRIPNLVGQDYMDVQSMMTDYGLSVTMEAVYSEEYEKGTVIEQSIRPGEQAVNGMNIVLTVSAGSSWYDIDNYVGMTEAEVRALLGDFSAYNIHVEYIDSDAPVGVVVAQSVEAGRIRRDAEVVFTVSGRELLMPSLLGLPIDGAKALLESEGLVVGEISQSYTADAKSDVVIAQSVENGVTVMAGTAIDLTVSEKRESIYAPEGQFTFTVPLDGSYAEVVLTAPSGSLKTVYTGTLDMGSYQIELSDDEIGEHTVSVYISGELTDVTTLNFE